MTTLILRPGMGVQVSFWVISGRGMVLKGVFSILYRVSCKEMSLLSELGGHKGTGVSGICGSGETFRIWRCSNFKDFRSNAT